MVKMTFTNNQTAFEYALYMISSSYFNKAKCVTKLSEGSMLLHYKEQKTDKQYRMEEFCIRFMDSLVRDLPEDFFDREVEVRLRRTREGEPTEIYFSDEHGAFILKGYYADRKSEIEYEIVAA